MLSSRAHQRMWMFLGCLIVSLSLLGTTAFAGKPAAEFDVDGTPLQKAIRQANLENAKKKKEHLGPGEKKDKCAAAIAANNDDDIAKWCDVAKRHSEKLGHQDFKHADGKAAGRRVVTKTVLEFESPKQKGRPGDADVETWPATKLKAFERKAEHSPGPVNGSGGHTLASAVLPSPADNDDHDCVDWVTGQRSRGNDCFDSDGKLLATLTANSSTTCTHKDGSVFFGDSADSVEDDCWDAANALKTTLVESIDEDGPESLDNDGDGEIGEDPPGGGNEDGDCIAADGTIHHGSVCTGGKGAFGETFLPLVDEDGPDFIDNDGDGRTDEDAPAAQIEDDCQRLYRKAGLEPKDSDKDADGQCDIGRALVKFVNDEAVRKGKKKVFQAKDDGTYDPNAQDGIEPGKESRRITLTESFGVKCKKGSTYIDGVCVSDRELEAAGGVEHFQASMKLFGGPSKHDADDPDLDRVAMMGFTFAPPVIEWGYRIEEEVCVLGICVEIFSARIGYEFDLALGLRLPVEIEVLDQPESVLAGRDVTLQTQVEPLDFTASQFEELCRRHDLADGLLVSDCKRFGFPDFLDEAFSAVISDEKKDGDEFVARYTAFAGVQVRVLSIPIINWALDSSIDVPAACTIARLIELAKDPSISPDQVATIFNLILNGPSSTTEEKALEILALIKDAASACGTFTTPFGIDTEDSPPSLRTFPAAKGIDIRADCAQAIVEKEVITIGGKPRPICTNLILGVSGASLGIGLGLEATVGSRLIDGSFKTAEDATRSGGLQWQKSANESGATVDMTIRPDNYDSADFKDTARVRLDDFTYYLNALQISLSASLQFGGILEPIPDIGSFTIFNFIISTGTYGIPIPQHPGTDAIAVDIPVENYGLKVDVHPATQNAATPDTLLIKPGTFGAYDTQVRNIGSRTGAFDFFRVELSNRPDQTAPYRYGIDPNTDHDCVSAGSTCTRGAVYFRGEQCYDAAGNLLAGMMACIDEDPPSSVAGLSREQRDDDGDGIPDEDPPEGWVTSPDATAFNASTRSGVAPYTWSSPLRISVQPFRHPLTRPGIYPVRITADSVEAKAKSMASPDPSGNARRNAQDVSFVSVDTFFEPQVVVLNNSNSGKPATAFDYKIEGTNGGNAPDSMSVQIDFLDFNQAGCTLTTLGRLPAGTDPGCPYRAVPTAIPGSVWTTASTISPILPDPPALLEPLGGTSDTFRSSVPRDWAGMDDTTYRFRVTTVSQKDPDTPRATKNFTALHTVIATKESMTRYIGLEIADLIATLTAAETAGVKLGGLKPISVHPIRQMNDSALAAILAGNFAKASNNHATSIQLVEAFVKALDGGGKGLPVALFDDLHKRAAAMIADMARAEASNVTSAP